MGVRVAEELGFFITFRDGAFSAICPDLGLTVVGANVSTLRYRIAVELRLLFGHEAKFTLLIGAPEEPSRSRGREARPPTGELPALAE